MVPRITPCWWPGDEWRPAARRNRRRTVRGWRTAPGAECPQVLATADAVGSRPPGPPSVARRQRMHVVVNHLHFRDPVTDATIESMRDALQLVIDAGGIAARVVKVEDRHLILLLDFNSAEDADRAAREAGGPWMREHIVPLLSGGTERSLGAGGCLSAGMTGAPLYRGAVAPPAPDRSRARFSPPRHSSSQAWTQARAEGRGCRRSHCRCR